MKQPPIAHKLIEGFDGIYDNYPYLSGIVMAWRVREDNSVSTIGTDGPNLVYNREFMDKLTTQETKWIILHEAAHVFLGHHLREEKSMNHHIWNVSCDLAMNFHVGYPHFSCLLMESGCFAGMGTGPFGYMNVNLSAEEYYDILIEDAKECEGCAAPGEISAHPDLDGTQEQLEATTKEWEESVGNAISGANNGQGKGCGSLPGWVKQAHPHLTSEKARPDWRVLLREFTSLVSRNRYTYERPSRRAAGLALTGSNLILPIRRARHNFHLAYIIDTSGSMDIDDLNRSLTELQGILYAFPESKVDLFQCDTRMIPEATRTYTRADFPMRTEVGWFGRGGTDLSPAFVHAAQLRKFDAVLCLTDLEWNVATCPDPGIPTLWLNTGGGGYHYGEPKFGRVVNLD